MSFKLDYPSSELSKKIDDMPVKLGSALLMYCATKASELESKMKMKRPWTDRTGMAKATLNAKVSQPSQDIIRITLSHGVEYGIWLELANGKKYAIVGPTIREESPKVVEGLNGLLSKVKLWGGMYD